MVRCQGLAKDRAGPSEPPSHAYIHLFWDSVLHLCDASRRRALNCTGSYFVALFFMFTAATESVLVCFFPKKWNTSHAG